MSTHHPLGPSRLGQTALCPGSYLAQQGLHPRAPSEDAESGNRIHEALKTGNFERLSGYEELLARKCSNFSDKCANLYLSKGQSPAIVSELTIDLASGRWGTLDRAILVEGQIRTVVDFKTHRFGFPREIAELQLADYTLGAWMRNTRMTEQVIGVAYCPQDDSQLYVTISSAEEASYWKGRIQGIIDGAKEKNAKRVPSFDACQYCLALGHPERCPETIEIAATLTELLPAHYVFGSDKAAMAVAIAELSAEATLSLIEKARIAQIVSAAVLERAKELLLEGQKSNEWELVERHGPRHFRVDLIQLAQLLQEMAGEPFKDEVLKAATISPGTVEKLLVERREDGVSAQEARARAEAALKPYVAQGTKYHVLTKKRVGGFLKGT